MKKTLAFLTLLVSGAMQAIAAPPVPVTPAAVDSILYARPFSLSEGFTYDWRKERPTVTNGYLVVLAVDPALVYPRQSAQPVLYVDDQPAMVLNVGYPSGRVVVLIPGTSAPTSAWFGTPALPETVDSAAIESETALAAANGIGSVGGADADAALSRGGAALRTTDLNALLQHAATLVSAFAAGEVEQAKALANQNN